MFCNYCGTANPDDASFCNACGRPINKPATALPPTGNVPRQKKAPELPPAAKASDVLKVEAMKITPIVVGFQAFEEWPLWAKADLVFCQPVPAVRDPYETLALIRRRRVSPPDTRCDSWKVVGIAYSFD
jgi:zinc ribbon protein